MNSYIPSKSSLISKFDFMKFAGGVFSLLFLFYFFNKYPAKELIAGNAAIGREGVIMIIGFLLSLSAWYLNLHAESSLTFDTGYGCFYARQAAAQNFVLFFVISAFGNSILPDRLIWHIAAGIIGVVLCFYFLFEQWRITGAVDRLSKVGEIHADEYINPGFTYLGCLLIRWVGLGYGFYYLYKIIFTS